jgi:dihydroneopterin aldolase
VATLRISGIGFEARHGATAPERQTTRRFEVDVEVDADLHAAERSDRLADTFDFRDVCEVVVGVGTGATHHLLESLAHEIVTALFDRFPAASRVAVELRKLSPPYCAGNPTAAAVRIERAGR